MGAPATEDLRELERQLYLAAERGETMTRAAVQEEFSIGAGEADEMLDKLREHGKAFELAPGEWRGPTLDELDRAAAATAPRVTVNVPDEDASEDVLEAAGRRAAGVTGARVALVTGEPTVRLTMAIAQALDAPALGQVIKAAINGVEDGEVFVLEITP